MMNNKVIIEKIIIDAKGTTVVEMPFKILFTTKINDKMAIIFSVTENENLEAFSKTDLFSVRFIFLPAKNKIIRYSNGYAIPQNKDVPLVPKSAIS